MMATFRIHLAGNNHPLLVDLPAVNIADLIDTVARAKFIAGTLAEPDDQGGYPGVMIAVARILCAVEV